MWWVLAKGDIMGVVVGRVARRMKKHCTDSQFLCPTYLTAISDKRHGSNCSAAAPMLGLWANISPSAARTRFQLQTLTAATVSSTIHLSTINRSTNLTQPHRHVQTTLQHSSKTLPLQWPSPCAVRPLALQTVLPQPKLTRPHQATVESPHRQPHRPHRPLRRSLHHHALFRKQSSPAILWTVN